MNGPRGKDVTFLCRVWRVQHWLVCHGGRSAFIQGETVAQLLHLALHLGVAVSFAHALEVWLDDTLEVLLLAAATTLEGVLLNVALELCRRSQRVHAEAGHDGALGPEGSLKLPHDRDFMYERALLW